MGGLAVRGKCFQEVAVCRQYSGRSRPSAVALGYQYSHYSRAIFIHTCSWFVYIGGNSLTPPTITHAITYRCFVKKIGAVAVV